MYLSLSLQEELVMAPKIKASQPVELRDHYFSLEDGLKVAPMAVNGESDSEGMSHEFAAHFVPPNSIFRLLIEQGDYSAAPICFKHSSKPVTGWLEWICHEMEQEEYGEAINEAEVKISLFISGFCEVYKDDICLRHVVRRWSPFTHTFICSWGEFTPTLEDVNNIMRLPSTGDADPFSIVLDQDEKEKLAILELCACFSKERFRFCHWVRHFWGSVDGEGVGFASGCRLAAMFAYWLSRFLFPDFPYKNVQRFFLLAIKLADGVRFPLAPLFLSHQYRMLD